MSLHPCTSILWFLNSCESSPFDSDFTLKSTSLVQPIIMNLGVDDCKVKFVFQLSLLSKFSTSFSCVLPSVVEYSFSQCRLQYTTTRIETSFKVTHRLLKFDMLVLFKTQSRHASKCYPSSFQYSTKVYYHPWSLLHPPLWTYFVPRNSNFSFSSFYSNINANHCHMSNKRRCPMLFTCNRESLEIYAFLSKLVQDIWSCEQDLSLARVSWRLCKLVHCEGEKVVTCIVNDL